MSQDKSPDKPNQPNDLLAGVMDDLSPINMLLGMPDDILEDFRAVAITYELPKLKAFFDALPEVSKELDDAPNQAEFMPAIQKIFMKIIRDGTQGISLFPNMDEIMEAMKGKPEVEGDDNSDPK